MTLRKTSIALMAAGTLSLLAFSQQALAKSGLVDMQKIFQSPTVQSMMKSGATDEKAIQTAYQVSQKSQAAANKAKGAEKKVLEAKAKTDQANFQSLLQKNQAAAKAKQQVIQTKVTDAIATVSKKEGLNDTLLKQAVFYSEPGQYIDITSDVIKTLGK